MVSDIGSSSAGAALAIRQGLNQQNFGLQALAQSAQPQGAVAALTGQADQSGGGQSGGGQSGGGNVTATRGQNLNIVV